MSCLNTSYRWDCLWTTKINFDCFNEKCKRAIRVESGRPSTPLASYGIPLQARVELTRLLRGVDVRNLDPLAPLKDGGQEHLYLRCGDCLICRKCDNEVLADRHLGRLLMASERNKCQTQFKSSKEAGDVKLGKDGGWRPANGD